MKRLYCIILLFLATYVYGDEVSIIERINSHILIEDYTTALEDAKIGSKKFSKSNKLRLKYIECLALNDNELEAIKELKAIKETNNYDQNHDILENVSWAILNKASKSTQYTTRLTTLIGVHLTHDVRAVKILNKLMKDSNAIIRTVALQLSSSYMDKPLRDTVENLFSNEKLWIVKLEVIKAIGKMKVFEKQVELKEIIGSEKSSFEEKQVATEALVNISENINIEEIQRLGSSPKAGLRKLSLDLIAYFDVKKAQDIVIKLVQDPISEVRVAALNTISLNFLKNIKENELKKILLSSIDDTNPGVAITASYIAILKNYSFGEKKLSKYFGVDDRENARFAASVLARLSNKCTNLKKRIIDGHPDIYVKANLALGLIAEKKFMKEASNSLFAFLKNDEKLMWESSQNPLFQVLSPSYIRHIDQIPRYPEAIDQMTRLHILSMLAIVEDPRAFEGIKNFLKQKGWGITGFASATLLKEGDEDALSIIRELLDEKDQDVKVQAALVLALLGKEEGVISTLEKAYIVADYNMKIQILEAIGHIGSKKSIKFLVNILDEPYQNLRVVAASSMIRCINS
ncbi:MAG: hypothetical protein K940chlam1_00522 [Candidatus Anoxychlamydiales bacterium]|nr:hypothetical protein [Candidatus Anoxychlamydiales bacterium]NGX35881.1 hypothetical protein [Candidatus Anoxychlamydiales bacterium]